MKCCTSVNQDTILLHTQTPHVNKLPRELTVYTGASIWCVLSVSDYCFDCCLIALPSGHAVRQSRWQCAHTGGPAHIYLLHFLGPGSAICRPRPLLARLLPPTVVRRGTSHRSRRSAAGLCGRVRCHSDDTRQRKEKSKSKEIGIGNFSHCFSFVYVIMKVFTCVHVPYITLCLL